MKIFNFRIKISLKTFTMTGWNSMRDKIIHRKFHPKSRMKKRAPTKQAICKFSAGIVKFRTTITNWNRKPILLDRWIYITSLIPTKMSRIKTFLKLSFGWINWWTNFQLALWIQPKNKQILRRKIALLNLVLLISKSTGRTRLTEIPLLDLIPNPKFRIKGKILKQKERYS